MTVVLEEVMGSDLTIVNNARASLDAKTDWDYQCLTCDADADFILTFEGRDKCESHGHNVIQNLSQRDEGLLRSLAKNRHGTPFESVVFRFHVDTNIRVSREWFRHRIGSFNEMSTRYMKMDALEELQHCYMPEGDAIRANAGKIMSYQMETITDPTVIEYIEVKMAQAYAHALGTYHELLEAGLSREVAAYVLPLGFRTAFYWTVNLRSVFNFLNLRNAPSALYEIRQEAIEVENLVKQAVPVAYDEWNANGRLPI